MATGYDLKELALKDIRGRYDIIQIFLKETYTAAESAVETFLTKVNNGDDVLNNMQQLNTALKHCRDKLDKMIISSIHTPPTNPSKVWFN